MHRWEWKSIYCINKGQSWQCQWHNNWHSFQASHYHATMILKKPPNPAKTVNLSSKICAGPAYQEGKLWYRELADNAASWRQASTSICRAVVDCEDADKLRHPIDNIVCHYKGYHSQWNHKCCCGKDQGLTFRIAWMSRTSTCTWWTHCAQKAIAQLGKWFILPHRPSLLTCRASTPCILSARLDHAVGLHLFGVSKIKMSCSCVYYAYVTT